MRALCATPRVTIRYEGCAMPKKRKSVKRLPWTKSEDRSLKAHSKRKTPVVKISKEMKRTVGALRQRAYALGISLGHQT